MFAYEKTKLLHLIVRCSQSVKRVTYLVRPRELDQRGAQRDGETKTSAKVLAVEREPGLDYTTILIDPRRRPRGYSPARRRAPGRCGCAVSRINPSPMCRAAPTGTWTTGPVPYVPVCRRAPASRPPEGWRTCCLASAALLVVGGWAHSVARQRFLPFVFWATQRGSVDERTKL
jgi:hypothetical protein